MPLLLDQTRTPNAQCSIADFSLTQLFRLLSRPFNLVASLIFGVFGQFTGPRVASVNSFLVFVSRLFDGFLRETEFGAKIGIEEESDESEDNKK